MQPCRLTLFISLALATLACTAPSPQTQTEKASEAPQGGGTFVIATRGAAPILHRFTTASSFLATNQTLAPIYQTLLSLDYKAGVDFRNSYQVIPWLAESWEVPDDTTYLFRIRKGVTWHDGKEFTANDVVWSYEYLRDPSNRFSEAAALASADRIEAADDYTLRITTKARAPNFLLELTGGGAGSEPGIVPRHVFGEAGSFDKTATGTGPFKLESWDPQSGAVLVRNAGYWQPGKPYLDRIKLVYGVEPTASIAAFHTQQNDVLKLSDKPQFDTLHALVPDAPYEPSAQQTAIMVAPRIDRPPFNDGKVRRAMHLAIDRRTMIDTVTFGAGVLSTPGINGARAGWAIPQEELATLPGYRDSKEADRTEARRLLAEAGYPNGLKTSISYSAAHTLHPGEAQFLGEEFRKVGIQVDLRPLDNAVFVKTRTDGAFDLILDSSEFLPHKNWKTYLHSAGGLNPGIRDDRLDRLIESFVNETDEGRQKESVLAVQRLPLDKNYVIPTIVQMGFLVWQPYVHGYADNQSGQTVGKSWPDTWVDAGKLPAGR